MSTIRCDYVLHLDIEALTFFVFFLVTEALLPHGEVQVLFIIQE